MADLVPDMLAGTINPGQLEIVREIKTAVGPDFDTAMFSGPRANYTISTAFDGTTVVRTTSGPFAATTGPTRSATSSGCSSPIRRSVLPNGAGRTPAPGGC